MSSSCIILYVSQSKIVDLAVPAYYPEQPGNQIIAPNRQLNLDIQPSSRIIDLINKTRIYSTKGF